MSVEYGESSGIIVDMEGPFGSGGGASVKFGEVNLPVSGWKGGESPYSQEVAIDAVSTVSMVDLRPGKDQLAGMMDFVLSVENDGGVITVYAFGKKPDKTFVIPVTITEVTV